MFFEAMHLVNMRETPGMNGAPAGEMLAGEVGREISEPQDGWHELEILTNFFPPRSGWVLGQAGTQQLLREVEAPEKPDFTIWSFLKATVETEIRFNAARRTPGFFIVADFLIGWGDIVSKLKNIGQKDPRADGTGPFQISSADWAGFCNSPLGSEFVAEDREDGLAQVSGAAFLALTAMDEISKAVSAHDTALGDGETSGETGPYIPSYVDILIAVLLSVPFAVDIRLAKLDNNAGSSIKPILDKHFPGNGDAVADYRQDLLKSSATTDGFETVDGLLLAAESMLAATLARAFKLISDNIPEDLPKVDGTAPWHAVATREDEDWSSDHIADNAQVMGARIGAYQAAAGLNAAPIVPWCGCFATFCMRATDAFGQTVVDEPARAANWVNWGNMAIPLGQSDVPKGAVVVLAPEKGSARSGHVGFFERYFDTDPTMVELVGGNQGGKVARAKFARSKIVSIRWLSPSDARDQQSGESEIGKIGANDLKPLTDLIVTLESSGNFNAFFGHSHNQTDPKFVTMSVRAVLEWQRVFLKRGSVSSAVGGFQFLRRTLAGLRDDGVITSDAIFNEATQLKLAIALMTRRGLGRYRAGTLSAEDFAVNLAKEWASLPVPKDVKKGNRTVRAGASYYAGDNINRALVSVAGYMQAVRAIGKT